MCNINKKNVYFSWYHTECTSNIWSYTNQNRNKLKPHIVTHEHEWLALQMEIGAERHKTLFHSTFAIPFPQNVFIERQVNSNGPKTDKNFKKWFSKMAWHEILFIDWQFAFYFISFLNLNAVNFILSIPIFNP